MSRFTGTISVTQDTQSASRLVLNERKNGNTPRKSVSILESWIHRYNTTQRPVPVNFSKLTSDYYIKDKATHLMHPYPAKLLRQIPEFFIDALTHPGEVVLDPFSGSGTVPLEALIAGRRALATEINPLARLITQVKTTPIPIEVLALQAKSLVTQIDLRRHTAENLPDVLWYWHAPQVIKQLSAISNAIQKWSPNCAPEYRDNIKNFMLLMFSTIIRKKSLADPRIAPPVRLNPKKFRDDAKRYQHIRRMIRAKRTADCLPVFQDAISEGLKRLATLNKLVNGRAISCQFIGTDAKFLNSDGVAVDLIMTSPPYIAAQKYVRSTSLELYWLGFLRDGKDRSGLEHRIIGSEIPKLKRGQSCPKIQIPKVDRIVKKIWCINHGRAKIVSNYFGDMTIALQQMAEIMRPGGHLVIVVGNNTVCGRSIPVSNILRDICVSRLGLSCRAILMDKIRAYGLMTKRNHTADIITKEYILVMQKPLNPGVQNNV